MEHCLIRHLLKHINIIQNRVRFKVKSGYYLELLAPDFMKLFGSTKEKITKDKNGENVPHLENIEVVLVHCNIASNKHKRNP